MSAGRRRLRRPPAPGRCSCCATSSRCASITTSASGTSLSTSTRTPTTPSTLMVALLTERRPKPDGGWRRRSVPRSKGTSVSMADGTLRRIGGGAGRRHRRSCYGSGDFPPGHGGAHRPPARHRGIRISTRGGRTLVSPPEHTTISRGHHGWPSRRCAARRRERSGRGGEGRIGGVGLPTCPRRLCTRHGDADEDGGVRRRRKPSSASSSTGPRFTDLTSSRPTTSSPAASSPTTPSTDGVGPTCATSSTSSATIPTPPWSPSTRITAPPRDPRRRPLGDPQHRTRSKKLCDQRGAATRSSCSPSTTSRRRR